MEEPLDLADLVEHRDRPGSHGVVEKRLDADRVLVQWVTLHGGRAVGEPEVCGIADLVKTYCPDCGEEHCWCGVGR